MFSSEDVTQTTEALEKLPRMFNHRSALNERRQQILQHKQTDALPLLTDTATTKLAWRQVGQVREENRRLRATLEELQVGIQQLESEQQQVQQKFAADIAVIHTGHLQEIAHYQTHLLDLMEERNRLQDEYTSLEQVQQQFTQRFEQAVAEQTQVCLQELAQAELADTTQVKLQEFVKAVETKAKLDGDRYLAEVVHLKREMGRIVDELEVDRRQLEEERRQLAALQLSAREQSEMRQKELSQRLRSRWKVASLLTAVSLIVVLIALQFACLALFHVVLAAPLTLALVFPIVLCGLVALLAVSPPLQTIRHIYQSAPRLKKSS